MSERARAAWWTAPHRWLLRRYQLVIWRRVLPIIPKYWVPEGSLRKTYRWGLLWGPIEIRRWETGIPLQAAPEEREPS